MKHSAFMLIFVSLYCLRHLLIWRTLFQKCLLYVQKSKNGLYAWFSPSRLCLYLFCKDCRLHKGLNTLTDWAFSLTLSYGSSLNRWESTNYINIYIYIYTQYKTNILKCFYLIAFSNLVVHVVHCFLEKKHEKRKKTCFSMSLLVLVFFLSLVHWRLCSALWNHKKTLLIIWVEVSFFCSPLCKSIRSVFLLKLVFVVTTQDEAEGLPLCEVQKASTCQVSLQPNTIKYPNMCVCVCVCVWGILVRVPTALSFRYGIELGDRFRSFWGILTTSGLRSSLSPIDPRCDISVQTHTRTHAHWHGCSFSVFLHHSSNLSGIVENKAHHAWAYMNVPTHTLYMWFTGALHRHNDKLCFLYPNTMPHRQLLAFFSVWYFLCGVCVCIRVILVN